MKTRMEGNGSLWITATYLKFYTMKYLPDLLRNVCMPALDYANFLLSSSVDPVQQTFPTLWRGSNGGGRKKERAEDRFNNQNQLFFWDRITINCMGIQFTRYGSNKKDLSPSILCPKGWAYDSLSLKIWLIPEYKPKLRKNSLCNSKFSLMIIKQVVVQWNLHLNCRQNLDSIYIYSKSQMLDEIKK